MSKKEYAQLPVHMHEDKIAAALRGNRVPVLSPEIAELESWGDLIPASDPHVAGEYLGVTLEPFRDPKGRRITGNEHDIYVAPKLPGWIIKLDRIPVEPDIAKERGHGYGVAHEINPEHLPPMKESFSIAGTTSGIVVKEVFSHEQEAEAQQRAEAGDPSLLDEIIKNPFTRVLNDWGELRLPVSYDGTKPDNYRVDPDGNQVLIDSSIWLNGGDLVEKREQILGFMRTRGDEPDRIDRVTNHLDALAHQAHGQAA